MRVVITFSRLGVNRVCMVADPTRGQLNSENGIFPVCPLVGVQSANYKNIYSVHILILF